MPYAFTFYVLFYLYLTLSSSDEIPSIKQIYKYLSKL